MKILRIRPSGVLWKLTRPIHPGLWLINIFFQRILGINSEYKWMINFTSRAVGNIVIGENVWISFAASGGCYFQGNNEIFIGDNTIFAPNVCIVSADHDPEDFNKWLPAPPIRIGKSCWIGAGARILPGVTLGDHVIVGAGAVVTESFPNNVVVAGVPAKIVRKTDSVRSCD